MASWSCSLLQTPERFKQLAQAVPHSGIQQINAGLSEHRRMMISSHMMQKSSILLAVRSRTPRFVMQWAENTIHTGPCARAWWRQDKDLHFVIPKYSEDGKGHLGCAACTLLPAARPPGEYVLDCRHVGQGPYIDYICASPWLPTQRLKKSFQRCLAWTKELYIMLRRV